MVGRVTKIKNQAAARVPQNRAEVVEAIAEIGRRQRERTRIETEMNDELAKIRQKYEEQALPHTEAIKDLVEGAQTWCEANRAELLGPDEKTKTVNLASGEVRWRITPPKVVCRSIEAAIEKLEELRLKDFIRIKKELNKEMILSDPEAVKPVSKLIKIVQTEEFVIVPFETQLEELV